MHRNGMYRRHTFLPREVGFLKKVELIKRFSIFGPAPTASPLESIFSLSSCSSSLRADRDSVSSPTEPLVVWCFNSTALSSSWSCAPNHTYTRYRAQRIRVVGGYHPCIRSLSFETVGSKLRRTYHYRSIGRPSLLTFFFSGVVFLCRRRLS